MKTPRIFLVILATAGTALAQQTAVTQPATGPERDLHQGGQVSGTTTSAISNAGNSIQENQRRAEEDKKDTSSTVSGATATGVTVPTPAPAISSPGATTGTTSTTGTATTSGASTTGPSASGSGTVTTTPNMQTGPEKE